MAITVYQYPSCSTCRKALKWLEARGVEHQKVDIVLAPPSATRLRTIKKLAGAPLRKLFNTAGQSYRQGNWKDRLPAISEADALAALAADGKLIKRPLVLGDDFALIGFREAEWSDRLG